MDITIDLVTALFIAFIGTLVSILASLLTKFFFDKTLFGKSKIKIGGVEIQLSESADESTQKILSRVQELQKFPQIFLSYSYQDSEFAQRLATDLRNQGIKVWIADEQVKVGDRILDTIREGISSSQWAIFLLSENSRYSDFVSNESKELDFALDEEKKRGRPFILPALISDTKLPMQLQDKQYANFRENYNLSLEKIFERVKPAIDTKGTRRAQKIDIAQSLSKVNAISEVDVVAKLEGLAKGNDLNWKVSIVDLLKLLDIDSSREAREELAKELGAPADVMTDSARMNVWLHKTVLKKIAANSGNISADVSD